ncbi:MAG: hypothetical protein HUU20_00680 [Pirellulales bacterium]|nr:hypothetical protein [Pirellulales bacterium]
MPRNAITAIDPVADAMVGTSRQTDELLWIATETRRTPMEFTGRKKGSRTAAAALSALALFLATIVSGCGTSPIYPPVTIEYRDSLFGIGKVVIISNPSSHHLYNVRVVGRNLQEMSSASVKATDHLSPGSFVQVGWLEFENWAPQPGESIEVYADGYVVPAVSIIPKD